MKAFKFFPFALLVVYFVSGFIALEFDPTKWTAEGRFFLVWVSSIFTLLLALGESIK